MELSGYLFDSHQRVYWLYLLSSFLIASAMVANSPKFRGYFSKNIFWHKSARLDYQYFVLISVLKAFVILPLLFGANEVGLFFLKMLQWMFGYFEAFKTSKDMVIGLYMLSLFMMGDLSRYWLHRWLHSVPFLWRFHRVHHSAEILNPLTFYRVHPVENILFGVRHSLSVGLVTGVFLYFFGAKIGTVEFFGTNIFVFIFGMLGANLRHSHIPLRYGIFEKFLISPYMHQLHHTKEYSNKNFGGVLSIWDGLFQTRHVEKSRDDLSYGLKEKNPHINVWSMFYEPFTGIK